MFTCSNSHQSNHLYPAHFAFTGPSKRERCKCSPRRYCNDNVFHRFREIQSKSKRRNGAEWKKENCSKVSAMLNRANVMWHCPRYTPAERTRSINAHNAHSNGADMGETSADFTFCGHSSCLFCVSATDICILLIASSWNGPLTSAQ